MPIEISEGDASAPRTLALGDGLVLRLAENPTTGYRWQLSQSGPGELSLVEERFVAGADGAAPGAGGHRLVRFIGRRSGEVRVQAVLRRSWEAPDAAAQTRVYTIVVA
jgi:predicted secreted protein